MKYSIHPVIKTSLILLICISSSSFVMADFEEGVEANRAGDRQTAFKEFTLAAKEKNPHAYGKLASMYLYGLGIEKDHQQAYMWFHMSYLSGDKEAERFRDAASSTMTREQYLIAVEMAEKLRLEQELPKRPVN